MIAITENTKYIDKAGWKDDSPGKSTSYSSKDRGSISNTHMMAHSVPNTGSRGSDTLF